MSATIGIVAPIHELSRSQGGGGQIGRAHQTVDATPALGARLQALEFAHRTRQDFLLAANGLRARAKQAAHRGAPDYVVAELEGFAEEPMARARSYGRSLSQNAEALPIWPWVEHVRGISSMGLGQIIAEAGDLSRYDNPAKLWKRFGLYPDAKTRKGEKLEFAPRRRSVAIVMAENFIRQGDEYRDLYLDRKAYEMATHLELTRGHLHNRARRYVAKRFLRNLWREWRAIVAVDAPNRGLPALLPEET